MRDPFGSIDGFMGQFQGFMRNPMQYIMQKKMNIPQQFQNDPQDAIQYLLNSGQITQEQVNWANNISRQIQGNPLFQQFINKK